MGIAASIRVAVRNIITQLGSTATLYSFSSATKSYNDEGDVTVSSWGSGTSIKVISANHYEVRRVLGVQGEENNESDRVILIKDDVTIGVRDKLVIDTTNYLVDEIKRIDPIENQNLAFRVVLVKDVNY